MTIDSTKAVSQLRGRDSEEGLQAYGHIVIDCEQPQNLLVDMRRLQQESVQYKAGKPVCMMCLSRQMSVQQAVCAYQA